MPLLLLGRRGVCQRKTTRCATAYRSGLCPGDASIMCCPEPTPKCTAVSGQCQQTTLPCAAGAYAPNLCPGATNIQCCHRSTPTPGAQPFGPDVSHYQGKISWPAVKTAGVGFAIAKATEGLRYVDTTFKTNWAGMASAGISVRGAYHFGHPKDDAVAQAHHFVATVGTLRKGDFVVLDIEVSDKVTASKVAVWSSLFVKTLGELLGLPKSRVWVYTGAWFWNPQAGGSSTVGSHPLWVSGYVPSNPPVPKGWTSWTMWQYTDKGKIPGINGCVTQIRLAPAPVSALAPVPLSRRLVRNPIAARCVCLFPSGD